MKERVKNKKITGFTLIEIVIVVGIMAVLAAVVLFGINNWKNKAFIETEAKSIVALMREAQNLTLSSFEDTNYGIHFASSTVTRFKGETYNELDSDNEVLELDGNIIVENIDFVNGGVDLFFERLTGEASNYGTTTIGVGNESGVTRQIIINQSGIVKIVN